MSRNEDYLDNLLTSVTDKLNEFDEDFEQSREALKESYQTQNDLPSRTQSALDEVREDNFLKEFENELQADGLEDDFMREFEQELSAGTDSAYDSPQVNDYVNEMGRIVDSSENADDDALEVDTMSEADPELESIFQDDVPGDPEPQEAGPQELEETMFPQEDSGQNESIEAPEGFEGLEDIFGDSQAEDSSQAELEADSRPGTPQEDRFEEPMEAPQEVTELEADEELEKMLSESDEDALSEIGNLLEADQNGSIVEVPLDPDDPFSSAADFAFKESAIPDKKTKPEKKKKEKNSDGVFGKLSHLLFGAPEELDPETAAKIAEAAAASGKKELTPKEIKEKKKQEKELKKQQKKEAAEEKKKEKEAAKAEKAAKQAAKPKKEKKKKPKKKLPKETPLPKVPVAMMWIIALSVLVLICLGTFLYGHSLPLSESKEAYAKGDYVTAYVKLKDMKRNSSQEEMFQAASALAGIQTEIQAYTALMEQKQYEMALDALIRGYGRCSVHAAQAEEWGVSDQLEKMKTQLVKLLKQQFNVTGHKAAKLYKIKRRDEYTLELHKILDGLGLLD